MPKKQSIRLFIHDAGSPYLSDYSKSWSIETPFEQGDEAYSKESLDNFKVQTLALYESVGGRVGRLSAKFDFEIERERASLKSQMNDLNKYSPLPF